MKTLLAISVFIFTISINAQFKEQLNKKVDIRNSISNNQPSGFFLDFINPENFSMSHSFSASYSAFSGHAVSLGVYTNSMKYKFNDKMNIEVDASLVNSPYNTLGDAFTNNINGFYISRAELNYAPSENMEIKLQFFNSPLGNNSYRSYGSYGNYGSPFLW
ncbi:MAG: hypothetical protein KKA84_08960 [Bacteroidetes bacterium]|nr:hypothetical protein [Bacteroidota bacterium]